RGHARPLHELVGRDEEVAVERLERADVLGRGDHPAQPPARHREGLREPVEHERLVRELENRAVAAALGETVVDLVRDDGHAALAREGGEVPGVTSTWSGETLTP